MQPQLRVLVGDAVAIAVFALLARIAHRSAEMPLTVGGWLSTLWPFLLGVLLGWAVSQYAARHAADAAEARRVWPTGVIAWIVTVVVGLGIWAIRNAAIPHISFIIVAGSMSALLMLGWRGVAALTARRG